MVETATDGDQAGPRHHWSFEDLLARLAFEHRCVRSEKEMLVLENSALREKMELIAWEVPASHVQEILSGLPAQVSAPCQRAFQRPEGVTRHQVVPGDVGGEGALSIRGEVLVRPSRNARNPRRSPRCSPGCVAWRNAPRVMPPQPLRQDPLATLHTPRHDATHHAPPKPTAVSPPRAGLLACAVGEKVADTDELPPFHVQTSKECQLNSCRKAPDSGTLLEQDSPSGLNFPIDFGCESHGIGPAAGGAAGSRQWEIHFEDDSSCLWEEQSQNSFECEVSYVARSELNDPLGVCPMDSEELMGAVKDTAWSAEDALYTGEMLPPRPSMAAGVLLAREAATAAKTMLARRLKYGSVRSSEGVSRSNVLFMTAPLPERDAPAPSITTPPNSERSQTIPTGCQDYGPKQPKGTDVSPGDSTELGKFAEDCVETPGI